MAASCCSTCWPKPGLARHSVKGMVQVAAAEWCVWPKPCRDAAFNQPEINMPPTSFPQHAHAASQRVMAGDDAVS